jgi:RND family efflux transporter MFP subunit
VLTAPFDGVVTERRADPGTMAVPGATLITLEDVTAFRIEVQLDEARAAAVVRGQTVEVRLDNAGRDDWSVGTVIEVARVDPSSHSFLVKVDIPPDPALRSGLFGRVRFQGARRPALAVPAGSLVRRGQLTFAFVVDGDGVARLRPLVTGSTSGDRVEVLAGVRAGEAVVLRPPPALFDGARVSADEPVASGAVGDRR